MIVGRMHPRHPFDCRTRLSVFRSGPDVLRERHTVAAGFPFYVHTLKMTFDAATATNGDAGWMGSFRVLVVESADQILGVLRDFIRDPSGEQIDAWKLSIPQIQEQAGKVMEERSDAGEYAAVLEYRLPMESRRPDVVFLFNGRVLVMEWKGRPMLDWSDIDQAHHYLTSLRNFHRECHDRPVDAVIVLGSASFAASRDYSGVHVSGVSDLHRLVCRLASTPGRSPLMLDRFLAAGAYEPLPSLMVTVRQVIRDGSLTRVHRSAAKTDEALAAIEAIATETAAARRRSLILLSGSPGTGKTLVGIRVAVSEKISQLAVQSDGRATSQPAIFLSGNRPLVTVLKHEFKRHGADARAFIRGVREYVDYYSRRDRIPPEHVLVFDEAQRAWDAEKVQESHGDPSLRSEPEMFIQFSERVPAWCTVIGLIGGGQEIHNGEEGGILQWAEAIHRSSNAAEWSVYGPERFREAFEGAGLHGAYRVVDELHLDRSIRFHAAVDHHEWVAGLVDESKDDAELASISARCRENGFHLRVTRSLDHARRYLWGRYKDDEEARFGLVMSSRDKCLQGHGVLQIGRFARIGEWYAEDELNPNSCRRLREAITQFEAQGLELDAALVCWGNDFLWTGEPRQFSDKEASADALTRWDDSLGKKWLKKAKLRNPLTLRRNTYRVLLTRGRQGSVIFVPPDALFDATYQKLLSAGCQSLDAAIEC
jgi:hypothetical protein